MSLLLNKTASDLILTISTVTNPTPILLAEGFGLNSVIQFEKAKNIVVEKTIDGTLTSYCKPVPIVGKINLQGNATGVLKLVTFLDIQSKINCAVPAVLTVISPSNFYEATYSPVIFTTFFTGFSFLDMLQEEEFEFEAGEVNTNILGSIASIATGVAGLL